MEEPKIRYSLREVITTRTSVNGNLIENHHVMIVLKHKETKLEKIHSTFTAFIKEYWGDVSINAALSRGQDVINFLNWMLKHKDMFEHFEAIEDLTFEMAESYLNNFSLDGVLRDTVKRSEWSIVYLYYYLAKNNLLKNICVTDFKEDSERKTNKRENPKLPKILSPLKNINYPPPRDKNSDLIHNLPTPLIPILFNVSRKYTPDITLGLGLGMFGGMRKSEFLNLTRSALQPIGKNAQNGFIADIRTRNLRNQVNKIVRAKSMGRVKKPRKQVVEVAFAEKVLAHNDLQLMYAEHVLRYKDTDGSGALFVDTEGKAMSTEVFNNRFKRLKKYFLKTLKESDDYEIKAYATSLKVQKWFAHILRGIFSNFAFDMSENPIETQVKRGDDHPSSFIDYTTDSDKMTAEFRDAQKGIYKDMFGEKLKQITSFNATRVNIEDAKEGLS